LLITHLVDVPDAIPTLVQWFNEEWGPYYGRSGPGDAERDLTECCQRDELPLALVALDASKIVVGTAALKRHSLETHPDLGPWLAALLVAPGLRGEGIASALITAIENEAQRLGFATLYSDTASGSTLLQRRGWKKLEENIQTLREPATLYRLELVPARN
jgi:GNAT superfamily N-acetyltransferase